MKLSVGVVSGKIEADGTAVLSGRITAGKLWVYPLSNIDVQFCGRVMWPHMLGSDERN